MDLINIVLGIITIAGTLFGAISFFDAKKSKKELQKYTYLFDIAEKNIDKNLTSEEINRLHDEKKAMDKIIKEEIPKQARITVIYDRLKADEEYLLSSYNRFKQTQKEYNQLQQEEKIKIPESILNEIEQQILPDYLIKEQKQKFSSMLTKISYATAFLSIIPILNIFSRYFIIFTAYPLIRIISLDMPRNKQERKKYILNIIHNFVLIIFLMINVYLSFFIFEQYQYHYRHFNTDLFKIFPITLLTFILLLVTKIIIIYKHRKK